MIPKKLHFIWLGNQPIPNESVEFINEWKKNYPDFECFVWSDAMIEKVNLIPDELKKYYFSNLPEAFRSDIARYFIINKYGGLYFDTDFQFLKRIPDQFLNFDFLGAIQNNGEVNMAFFASVPNTELLIDVINDLIPNIERYISNDRFTKNYLNLITGPVFFNNHAVKYLNRGNYFFFDVQYFYPYWFTEKHKKNQNFSVTSPLSYAVHHWNLSWIDQVT